VNPTTARLTLRKDAIVEAHWFIHAGHGYVVKPVSSILFEVWRLLPGLGGGSTILVTTFSAPHLPTSDDELVDFAITALESSTTRTVSGIPA
jgi:hypothetical protein